MAAVASQTSQRPRQHGSKRKGAPTDGDEELTTAKKIASERPKERPAADLDIDESIGHMNPGLLADYISKKIKRAFRDLSTVELEDKYLPQWIFYDTSDFDLSRKLDNLPTFLEHFSDSAGNLSNSSEDLGSPHTLVIAASGLRAADVTRSLRKFQSQESAVGKLFAKHIKLPEAVDYLKRTKMGIGTGTPQRLIDLLETGALKTNYLKRVVIDGSHVDQKKRSIFDMKELLDPLVKLLSARAIKTRLDDEETRTRIFVF